MLVVVDVFDDKSVMIYKEYESIYLRLKQKISVELHFFRKLYMIEYQDCFIVDVKLMINELLILMTETDLMTNFETELNFESIHSLYIRNLLLLYKLTDCNDLFLSINVLDEIKKIYKKEVE